VLAPYFLLPYQMRVFETHINSKKPIFKMGLHLRTHGRV
jgi:hypothetical protein